MRPDRIEPGDGTHVTGSHKHEKSGGSSQEDLGKSLIEKVKSGEQCALALIDGRQLTRELISNLLASSAKEFQVVSFENSREILDLGEGVSDVFEIAVLYVASASIVEEPVSVDIHRVKNEFRNARIVLLGERCDLRQVMDVLQIGVAGYVPTMVSSPVFVEVLRLVRAGGVFVPGNVFLEALPTLYLAGSVTQSSRCAARNDAQGGGRATEAAMAGAGGNTRFTPKQLQVLKLLNKGASNKVIAYELNMQECTVKVHLRQIMRKLRASNRTQAAIRSAAYLTGSDEDFDESRLLARTS